MRVLYMSFLYEMKSQNFGQNGYTMLAMNQENFHYHHERVIVSKMGLPDVHVICFFFPLCHFAFSAFR